MRAIADEFNGRGRLRRPGVDRDLRLLTTPIARYGKAGGDPEDGALFAFVEGTDPEVFLFVEARAGHGRPRVAIRPGPDDGCWAVQGQARRTPQVWDLPPAVDRRPVHEPLHQPIQFWP